MSNPVVDFSECPHCHAEVMFRRDGLCLACGKSRFDTEGVDPDRTLVTIDHTHALPECCFVCGEPTDQVRYLEWSFDANPFASWLVKLFSRLPGSTRRLQHHLWISVCDGCAKRAKRTQPVSVRAGVDCRLPVHRNFRRRFEELNGKPPLEWDSDIRMGSAPPKPTGPLKIDFFGQD